jgi:hypothetical protein
VSDRAEKDYIVAVCYELLHIGVVLGYLRTLVILLRRGRAVFVAVRRCDKQQVMGDKRWCGGCVVAGSDTRCG